MLHHVSPYLQYVVTINAPPLSPYLQNVSPIAEQHTFCSILYGEDPVSDLSLHVLWAPHSALWVIGCGSLVMPVPPTRPWAPHSTLWTMGQPRPRAQHRNWSDATYTTYISKLIRQPLSNARSALFSMEKTQSLISPYICYGLRALRYGLWAR